jgi:chaperone BCS1
MTQRLWYHGRLMRFTRSRRYLHDGDALETLRISILTRDHSVLTRLLLEAKQNYEQEELHRVSVYVSGMYNDWRRSGSRPKRPMESIILDPGVKDMVLADAQEFMASESWYSERGLPYRRGYLFHGCPGSGKTSLVHALAGALGLDIYVINLNKKGLDDSSLSQLVSELPARSIALIEEIDAAFHRGVSREPTPGSQPATVVATGESAGVTLGGLLSSIDGIQASEGRLLCATTNKYHALDPALTRPGRMDVHVEFTYASKRQAEELFKRFFTVTVSDDGALQEKPIATHSNKGDLPSPPRLTLTQRDELAAQFAAAIPDREFAMASLQGLLMNFKSNPSGVIPEVPRWVEKERSAKREREKATKGADEKVEVGEDEKKAGSGEADSSAKTNGVNCLSDPEDQQE